MSDQVMNPDKGQTLGICQSLRKGESDEQRADEPRSGRDRDPIEFRSANTRVMQCRPNDIRDDADVIT